MEKQISVPFCPHWKLFWHFISFEVIIIHYAIGGQMPLRSHKIVFHQHFEIKSVILVVIFLFLMIIIQKVLIIIERVSIGNLHNLHIYQFTHASILPFYIFFFGAHMKYKIFDPTHSDFKIAACALLIFFSFQLFQLYCFRVWLLRHLNLNDVAEYLSIYYILLICII